MINQKEWRLWVGHTFEFILFGISMLLLYLHPLAWTTDDWLCLALGIPLLTVAVVFPVTLPSMLVSLELVFTFYFVLTEDVATTLWVSFLGEFLGTLLQIRHNRKSVLLLNPALKVVCLGVGYAAFQLVQALFQAGGFVSGVFVVKLAIIGLVFFLLNHLVLNLSISLQTGHFNLKTAITAVKWESLIYLVVFPLSYLGLVMKPYAADYSLLVLAVPVAVVTYLFRGYNQLLYANRVNQACIKFSTTEDPSSIYDQAFQMARELTDSPKAMLLQRHSDGSFHGVDLEDHSFSRIRHPLLNRAIATQQMQLICHKDTAQNFLPDWEVRSLVLLPLVGKTEVFGIICLGKRTSHSYKKAHQSQLRYLMSQVSLVLDRNHAYEQLAKAAITNKLTGLYNYQFFYEQLDEQFHEAKAHGHELSIVLFDIDYFKKYNDIYGHIVGDEVLRQVAGIAKEVAEAHGFLLARYGGEEFAALGRTGAEQAYVMAEEIRQQMVQHQFSYQEHTIKNITISGGVADVDLHEANSPSDLLEKADQALYWGAKEMGRNRIAVYSSEYDQRLFIDSLTGLHTVHYLRRKLGSLCEHSSRFPMHFLLVDIRGMRKFNDKHGFEVGNQILIDASYLLKNTMRADDQIIRYVDDEFLIVIQGIPEEDIGSVCERIREKFTRHLFPLVGSTVQCDVSVVTMTEPEDQTRVLEWVNAARRRYPHAINADVAAGN